MKEMKKTVMPFATAFVAFAAAFLALDYAVMAMQGLTLIFQP